MLVGSRVTLRPVRRADLDALYTAHTDLDSRGSFFPRGVMSEIEFQREFEEHGFWRADDGMLLIIGGDGEIAGHIEFFRAVSYWDAFELSYQLYDTRFAGRGYTTEAVQLLVDYLFATKQRHRIQLVIVPDNAASRRVAQKCGFQPEGIVRGAFFNDGANHDVMLFGLVRTDPRPWHEASDEA